MALALIATGWWMYVEVPQTPQAVVICVIVFNAFFGFRYLHFSHFFLYCHTNTAIFSWGPIPWLYPPEVRNCLKFASSTHKTDMALTLHSAL